MIAIAALAFGIGFVAGWLIRNSAGPAPARAVYVTPPVLSLREVRVIRRVASPDVARSN